MSTGVRYWIIGIAVVIIALAAAAWLVTRPAAPFAVDPADHLSNWTIPVNADASSTEIFESRIAALKGQLATTTGSAADIDVDIANTYAALGDGKNAYRFYLNALTASSSETVAYADLGVLFAGLHATSTAIDAYAKAVALSPATEFYQLSLIQYLAQVAPAASSTAAAFAAAGQALGTSTPDYLITRAAWEEGTAQYAAAISDWEAVLPLVGAAQQAAIETEIARLRTQQ